MLGKLRKSKLHKFHLKYKWIAAVALLVGVYVIWRGWHEFGAVSMSIAFESMIHHVVEFAAEEA